MSKATTMSFSLRLMRSGVTPLKALKEDHDLEEVPSTSGWLFVGQSVALPPSWSGYLSHYSGEAIAKLRRQSCSAVLLLEAGLDEEKRLFALCLWIGVQKGPR